MRLSKSSETLLYKTAAQLLKYVVFSFRKIKTVGEDDDLPLHKLLAIPGLGRIDNFKWRSAVIIFKS